MATKQCPYCGETIQATAKKCRYCGEWLEETPLAVNNDSVQKENQQTQSSTIVTQQTATPRKPNPLKQKLLQWKESLLQKRAEQNQQEKVHIGAVLKTFFTSLSWWQWLILAISLFLLIISAMIIHDFMSPYHPELMAISTPLWGYMLVMIPTICMLLRTSSDNTYVKVSVASILLAIVVILTFCFSGNRIYTDTTAVYGFDGRINYPVTAILTSALLTGVGFALLVPFKQSGFLKAITCILCVVPLLFALIFEVSYEPFDFDIIELPYLVVIYNYILFICSIFFFCGIAYYRNRKRKDTPYNNLTTRTSQFNGFVIVVFVFLIVQAILLCFRCLYSYDFGSSVYEDYLYGERWQATMLVTAIASVLNLIALVCMLCKKRWSLWIMIVAILCTIAIPFLSRHASEVLPSVLFPAEVALLAISLIVIEIVAAFIPIIKSNRKSAYYVIWHNGKVIDKKEEMQ